MRSFPVRRLAGLPILAAIACIAPPAYAETAAADDPGPWRRVTHTMPAGASGHTVWMEEAAIVDPEGEAPSGKVAVRELTLYHGDTRVAGRAYAIARNVYECSEGFKLPGPVTVYDAAGTPLATAVNEGGERVPPIPHSITNEVWQAVCRNGGAVSRNPSAETIEAAIAHDDPAPFPDMEPARVIGIDIDRDERLDRASIHMRPHSHRHDVEIFFADEPERALTIVAAAQPPTGPLVERLIRAAAPGAYVYDCLIDAEGEPAEPCAPGVAHAGRGGIEIVTPGHPSILVYDPQYDRAPVRLPMAGG